MGPVSIKLYDKFSLDPAASKPRFKTRCFFQPVTARWTSRWLQHKTPGTHEKDRLQLPACGKSARCQPRYLKSSLPLPPGVRYPETHRLAETQEKNTPLQGLNLFSEEDTCLVPHLVARAEFFISGVHQPGVAAATSQTRTPARSTLLARLPVHGVSRRLAKAI